ncbi:hypothetical protein QQ045_007058 [Rhodiola kirilowii]
MMSVYYFPRKVIDEITRMISQFWWNKKEGRGISWVKQDVLQKRKLDGGLGFKDLKAFNDAILLKIVADGEDASLTCFQTSCCKILSGWSNFQCKNEFITFTHLERYNEKY